MSALHERVRLFDERNLFVHGLLGAVSTCRRIRAFIETHLMAPPSAGDLGDGEAPDRASAAVYAVLGCYSLTGAVETLVSGWAGETVDVPRNESSPRAQSVARRPGELLR
jgi:hypothetical protein